MHTEHVDSFALLNCPRQIIHLSLLLFASDAYCRRYWMKALRPAQRGPMSGVTSTTLSLSVLWLPFLSSYNPNVIYWQLDQGKIVRVSSTVQMYKLQTGCVSVSNK